MLMVIDQSSEKSPANLPNAKLTLGDRLSELQGRLGIKNKILVDFERDSDAQGLNDDVFPSSARKALVDTVSAVNDSDWVSALRKSGLSDDDVLKVWETKDSLVGKEADKLQDKSAA